MTRPPQRGFAFGFGSPTNRDTDAKLTLQRSIAGLGDATIIDFVVPWLTLYVAPTFAPLEDPMASENDSYDVIVIGAGPVGETAAARVVRGGLTAVVVETRLVGGECHFYGCVPGKALLWPMELAAAVGRMPGLTLNGSIDAAAVLERRDEFVSRYDDSGGVSWLHDLPSIFVRGRGRLAGPRQVEVSTPEGETRALRARHAVVIATGSTPHIPAVPGLRPARPWTNQEATSVQKVPKRLVVIGAGPVACEMSQALHALGAEEVTVI